MSEHTAEIGQFADAIDIDAELRSFVSVETRHAPTVRAVDDLRRRIALALGHDDLWCVAKCTTSVRHDDCECSCEHPYSPATTEGSESDG